MKKTLKNIVIFKTVLETVLGFFMVKLSFKFLKLQSKTTKLPTKVRIAVPTTWSNCSGHLLRIQTRLDCFTTPT